MENGVKTVNAELHAISLLCPASPIRHETYSLVEEWHNGLVPRTHFAVPAKWHNADDVPGCD
jgi:hypothetical protein